MEEVAFLISNECTCHESPQSLQTSDRREKFMHLRICAFAHLNFGSRPLPNESLILLLNLVILSL